MKRALLLALLVFAAFAGGAFAAASTAPSNTSPPTISGEVRDGETVKVDPGTWSGTKPIDFSYHWLRCDENGASCEEIAGATRPAYSVGSDDVDDELRVAVTAASKDGKASATSGPTELVKAKFDPSSEFELHDWVPIHLGSLDLSINKAVVYLLLGALLTCLLGIVLMRVRLGVKAGTRQTVGEMLYDVAQTQVAETGLPSKAIGLWFPYVATLMLFIWVVNMLGFIPLPLTGETWHGVPVWGIYAATSSLSVTLVLALVTFVFTHVEGIRWNGPIRYFRSWIPDVPKGLLPMIVPLEILSQFMRLISLSVRLYANMLAGHMLILTFIGLMFVLESVVLAVFVVPLATLFYLFEVIIVVSIQAFIFAALSAIYIGSAIEPEH